MSCPVTLHDPSHILNVLYRCRSFSMLSTLQKTDMYSNIWSILVIINPSIHLVCNHFKLSSLRNRLPIKMNRCLVLALNINI